MLNISSSESQAYVCIDIFNDTIYESSEIFSVELSSVNVLVLAENDVAMTNVMSLSPQGRLVLGGNGRSTVTIVDNDGVCVCVWVGGCVCVYTRMCVGDNYGCGFNRYTSICRLK